MGKIDKELEIKIIKHYADGVPMRFIAQELGLNTTSVFNVLRRNNVKTRTKGGIEQLDADEIIALYKSGIPSTKIASQKKVSVHTITNILEKHDVTRDNVYHNTSLKEDYWFDINTKDKAYFLGFLITDGNVIGNAVRLSLNIKDKHILETFADVTNNENKLYEDKRNCVVYGVKRAKWVEDLSKYGIVPNKTANVEMPILQDELMPHLIRGLIDGDGWITKRGQIGFCGNEKTVTQLRDYLVEKLGVHNVKVVQSRKTLFMVGWASKCDFKTICEYIYHDKGDFYLHRKFDNYQSVINGNTEVSSEIAQGSETP